MVKSSSFRRSSEKLVSSVESSHPGILHPVKRFVLKSNNTFACRASDVFNRLGSLENDHSNWMVNNEIHESFETDDISNNDAPTPNSSENVAFKKPYLPLHRGKKRGIIHKNKNTRVWRKYSLKNIPLSSDAKNAAVAFQFLSELRKKEEENICNETTPIDDKVIFRKPVKQNSARSTLVSCKEIASSSDKKPSIDSNVKLDHLQKEFE